MRTIAASSLLLALALAAATAASTPPLDIWIVPHAHCDVGWLMSVDGYFNPRRWDGSENSQSVSNILTEVTKALDADRDLRFIWSEVKWIQLWYPQQTPSMRAAFRRIIARGQLEFVGAGWSQNDEVTTAYYDVIVRQFATHVKLSTPPALRRSPLQQASRSHSVSLFHSPTGRTHTGDRRIIKSQGMNTYAAWAYSMTARSLVAVFASAGRS